MARVRGRMPARKFGTKSLGNQEDMEATAAAVSLGSNLFLRIPDEKTPWKLLNTGYTDGFAHWVDLEGGRATRIPCQGGPKGEGWAVDVCPLCKLALGQYEEARAEENEKAAERIKAYGNRIRAKHEVWLYAVRGIRVLTRTAKGKQWDAEFDLDEERVQVGILRLTHPQYMKIKAIPGSEDHPEIKDGTDLAARILWTTKDESQRGKYKEVFFTVDKRPTELDIDVPKDIEDQVQEAFDGAFAVSDEEMEKVMEAIGEGPKTEDGEEVELEDDDEGVSKRKRRGKVEEPDDDYLDDVAEEDEEETPKRRAAKKPEEEDDFQDDDPEEDVKTGRVRISREPEPKKRGRPARLQEIEKEIVRRPGRPKGRTLAKGRSGRVRL